MDPTSERRFPQPYSCIGVESDKFVFVSCKNQVSVRRQHTPHFSRHFPTATCERRVPAYPPSGDIDSTNRYGGGLRVCPFVSACQKCLSFVILLTINVEVCVGCIDRRDEQ